MAEQQRNLVQLFEGQEGFQTAVFLTYGVDLGFFEEAILSILRGQECRNHIIFADAARYEDTLQSVRGSFSWVGSHYLLVPVRLPKGLFHPKIALLTGPERGRLLVGSGNLTFSGYGQNRELFTLLDWLPEMTFYQQVFADVWRFIRELATRFANADAVDEMLEKGARRARWLLDEGSETPDLRFVHNLDESILAQTAAFLRGRQVNQATLFAPFFSATQIETLGEAVGAQSTRFILQPGRVVGNRDELYKRVGASPTITLMKHLEEERYIHAKAYLFATDAGDIALTGSPNCSRAALDATAQTGNIEAALLTLQPEPDRYARLFADEVEPLSLEELATTPFAEGPPPPGPATKPPLILRDAGLERLRLTLHFSIDQSLLDVRRLVVSLTSEVRTIHILGSYEPGEHKAALELDAVQLQTHSGPIAVRLHALTAAGAPDEEQGSNELWLSRMDHLRAAASRRRTSSRYAAEALLGLSDDEGHWRALYETLEQLFNDELARISSRDKAPRTTRPKKQEEESDKKDPSNEDIVVLVDDEDARQAEQAGRFEADLEEETEFSDFLWQFLGLLPGKLAQRAVTPPPGAGTDGTESGRRGKPWTKEHWIRSRSLRILRKYISSLGNPLYLPNLPANAAARGLAVFLAYARRLYLMELIALNEYRDYVQSLIEGFFGTPLRQPPITSLLHERHLLSDVAGVWRDRQVPFYVLASLHTLWHAESPSAGPLPTGVLRPLVGLAAMFGDLDSLSGDADAIALAAQAMDLDEVDLLVGIETLLTESCSQLIDILEEWVRQASEFPEAPGEEGPDTDPAALELRRRRFFQANVDYRAALFHLYRQEPGALQRRLDLCEELSFWNRRRGRPEEAARWDERLVDLAEQEGDSSQLAQALFDQGQQLFHQREYQQAISRLRQAETLAARNQDARLLRLCESYIKNTRFFLRRITSD